MNASEHQRWCIVNIPITDAENTIFYFMFGFTPESDFTAYRRMMLKNLGE